jgi:outer membrane usher protein FimD/PapC
MKPPALRWLPAVRPRAVPRALLAAWLAAAALLLPAPARGADIDATTMIVAVTVNGERKGEFFVYRTGDGDFLVKLADLEAMALRDLKGELVDVEGEAHLSLRSAAGIEPRLDEKTLTLEIAAASRLLGSKAIDLQPARRPGVLRPRNSSAFLNYRLGSTGGAGSSSLNFAAEAGVRVGDWLLASDYNHLSASGGERRSVRLMSHLTLDRREQLQRLVLGDFFTSSGTLGSPLQLGGISFSKRYTLDPYFVRYPMAAFAGAVPAPAEAEIYLGDMRVRTERLPAGEFLLQNFNYYGGARDIEIVLKDRFGREQRLDYRYYFTDTLLRGGLHEYSYDLGVMRRDFGTSSNQYGGAAASLFHRYGVSDNLTVGVRGEASKTGGNFGPELLLRVGALGTSSARLAASRDAQGRGGRAVEVGHDYQAGVFQARLDARHFSEHYAVAGGPMAADRPRADVSGGVGYGNAAIGNFGLDVSTSTRYQGTARRSTTFSYSKSLPGNLSLFATFGRVHEGTRRNEFFVGLSWSPTKDINASVLLQDRAGTSTQLVQVSRNVPQGEGWGWRLAAENAPQAGREARSVSPFVQYNGPYGIYTADLRSDSIGDGDSRSSYQFAASGAIAYVGGTIGLSRPIADSFGVIQVGSLPDVRVYQSNQLIGRTNAKGRLFVPNLTSYVDNQIGIEDKDVPFDYLIAEKERYVSPPWRSGSLVPFQVTRIQAFTGKVLSRRADGSLQPAEYHEGTLMVDSKPVSFVTGNGGSFYLENLAAGRFDLVLSSPAGKCRVDLVIPESTATIVELGEIPCEPVR